MTRFQPILWLLVVGCSGDTTTPPEPEWWTTCGDPVCGGYSGPFAGVDVCTDEQVAGTACTDEGTQCDPENDCNSFLQCAVSDPKGNGIYGCPI